MWCCRRGDGDFNELVLTPTEHKSLKTILRFTNELVRQSVIGVDAVLTARLVKDVSDAWDDALLTGDGADYSIIGLVNQANVTGRSTSPTPTACSTPSTHSTRSK